MRIFLASMSLMFSLSAKAGSTPSYERLETSCAACLELDKLLTKHSNTLDARAQAMVAIQTGNVIKKIRLKGKPELERKRMIFFALKATTEMMRDDFDNETVLGLIDLRNQAPKEFDSVFWTLSLNNQNDIVQRMGAMMDRKLRQKTKLPQVRELEN